MTDPVKDFISEFIEKYEKKKKFFSLNSSCVNAIKTAYDKGVDSDELLNTPIPIEDFISRKGSKNTYDAVVACFNDDNQSHRYVTFKAALEIINKKTNTVTFKRLLVLILESVFSQEDPKNFYGVGSDNHDFDSVAQTHISIRKMLYLKDNQAETNLKTIVAANQYAEIVAKALYTLDKAELLSSDQAQANCAAVVAAKEHAEIVAKALYVLGVAELLSGDQAQANRDAVVAAKEHAREVADALKTLTYAGLLSSDQAQANRDALVAAKEHAQKVADALTILNNAELLSGDQAQANRDALVAAKEHAVKVADALTTLNNAGLLSGVQAQANRDAVVAAKEHAREVAHALWILNNAELLSGVQAQANREEVVAAIEHAREVAYALKILNNAGLLSGVQGQANRDAVVAALEHAEKVALALTTLNNAGLLSGVQGQANRDAVVAAEEHAETVALVLVQLNSSGLLSGAQGQANRDAIVAAKEQATAIAEGLKLLVVLQRNLPQANIDNQMYFTKLLAQFQGVEKKLASSLGKLYSLVLCYPALLTQATFKKLLSLDVSKAKNIEDALECLFQASSNLMRSDIFSLLLDEQESEKNIAVFVNLITGRLSFKDFQSLQNNTLHFLKKIPHASDAETLSKAHFKLYELFYQNRFYQYPLGLIKGIIRLNQKEADTLFECISSGLGSHDTGSLSIFFYILWEAHFLQACLCAIPQSLRMNLPAANEFESSTRDDFIQRAQEQIEVLKSDLHITDLSDDDLNVVEMRIRMFLLSEIRMVCKNECSKLPEDKKDELARIEEKIAFINENMESLSNLTANADIVAKAIGYFNSNTVAAEIAWRAYQPKALCVDWPNLLTAPEAGNEAQVVFSTRASAGAQGELDLKTASDQVRRMMAVAFMASEKHSEMQDDFVYAVAEIRRAHNSQSDEVDNPSCQPGCVSRCGVAIQKYPKFAGDKRSPDDEKMIVEKTMRSLAQQFVNDYSAKCDDREARLLLTVIALFSHRAKEALLENTLSLDDFYAATDDDYDSLGLNQDETAKELRYFEKVLALRLILFKALMDSDDPKAYKAIVTKLEEAHLAVNSESIKYLIQKHLANIEGLVSLPPRLLEAYPAGKQAEDDATDSQIAETQSPQSSFKDALSAKFSTVPKTFLEKISDSLDQLIERLENPTASIWKSRPPLTAKSIEETVSVKLSGIYSNKNRGETATSSEIKKEDVIAIIKALFPATFPKDGSAMSSQVSGQAFFGSGGWGDESKKVDRKTPRN